MRVTFWGVRGSVPVGSRSHAGFGGNTACVEVECDGEHILLDAGTGVRAAGEGHLGRDVRRVSVLLSHYHWDHIQGFPFYPPAYAPRHAVRVYGGLAATGTSVRSVIARQLEPPNFPIGLGDMRSDLTFEDFHAGETLTLAPHVRVATAPLRHPGGATGYRIEHGGRVVCYATDTEHEPGRVDVALLALAEGADLLIYDATFTDEEYPARVGWGHSTWQEGVRLARLARVKRLALFHHAPEHDDRFLRGVDAAARSAMRTAFVAREGQTIHLPRRAGSVQRAARRPPRTPG
jgi:phosphoribosyl 1,2-cyclic phosphodiesterase